MAPGQESDSTDGGRSEHPPYLDSVEASLERLHSDREHGLSKSEVRRRRQRHGANRMRESRPRGIWVILIDQFKSVVILLLLAAAVAAAVFGH